jgi:hypothetical protein
MCYQSRWLFKYEPMVCFLENYKIKNAKKWFKEFLIGKIPQKNQIMIIVYLVLIGSQKYKMMFKFG